MDGLSPVVPDARADRVYKRAQNNRRETASIIKNNGNTGNEHAPVRLENPFAAQKPAAAAPTPVPASATVAADNPAGQPVKAPADDDEEYVWR